MPRPPAELSPAAEVVFVVSGVMTWTRFGNVGIDVFLFVISGWLIS
ncbi:site-2 protease family protein, partial [Actinoplanes sp. NPDC049802]